MANITITIETEAKKYLESLGHDITEITQRLLDSHLDRIINSGFNSKIKKIDKLKELNKK